MSGSGAAGTVPRAVASLAERVLKMMFLTRLTLLLASLMAAGTGAVAAVVLGLAAMAAGSAHPDPPKPGPDDLPGRVVDKSGAGVAGVQLWAVDGPGWTPKTVATDDDRRRRAGSWCRGLGTQPASETPRTSACSPAPGTAGSAGSIRLWLNSADGKGVEIELKPVGDVRGRLTDQNARPIAGVEVATELISPSADANAGNLYPA